MKRAFAGILTALLLASAQAEQGAPRELPAPAPAALEIRPDHLGYAFDQPEILLRQRLFGLAHALSLLAASCLDLPGQSVPIQDAYAAWHVRQAATIEVLVHDLAAYYFGPRVGEARWPDLVRALNLTDSIQPALGPVTLEDACASLPAAIVRPRYELDKLLAPDATPAADMAAAPAVPPAPNPRGVDE